MNELFIGVLMFGLTMPAVPAKPAAQVQLTIRQKWKLADRLTVEADRLEWQAMTQETIQPLTRASREAPSYSSTQDYLHSVHAAAQRSIPGRLTKRGIELKGQAVEKRIEAAEIYRKLQGKRRPR